MAPSAAPAWNVTHPGSNTDAHIHLISASRSAWVRKNGTFCLACHQSLVSKGLPVPSVPAACLWEALGSMLAVYFPICEEIHLSLRDSLCFQS